MECISYKDTNLMKCNNCPLKDTLDVCPARSIPNPLFCKMVDPSDKIYNEHIHKTIVNLTKVDISKAVYKHAPEDFFDSLRDNTIILVNPDLNLSRIKKIRNEFFRDDTKIVTYHDSDEDIQLDDVIYKMSKNIFYRMMQSGGLVFTYLMDDDSLDEFVKMDTPNCYLTNLIDPNNVVLNNSALYNVCFSKEDITGAENRLIYRADHVDDVIKSILSDNLSFDKPSASFIVFGDEFSLEYIWDKIDLVSKDFEVKFLCFFETPYSLDIIRDFQCPVVFSQNERTQSLIKTCDIIVCSKEVKPSRDKQSVVNFSELDRGDLLEYLKERVQSYNKLDLIKNFGKTTFQHAANGFQQATFKVMQERLDICSSCIKNIKGRCDVCGCSVANKISWAVSECPLGKWAKSSDGDHGCGCGK